MTPKESRRRKRWMWRGAIVGALIAIAIMDVLAAFILLFDPALRPPTTILGWFLALLPPALFGLPFGLVIGTILGMYASMMWRPRDFDAGSKPAQIADHMDS
jgi:purine-cytosine permease-like protein